MAHGERGRFMFFQQRSQTSPPEFWVPLFREERGGGGSLDPGYMTAPRTYLDPGRSTLQARFPSPSWRTQSPPPKFHTRSRMQTQGERHLREPKIRFVFKSPPKKPQGIPNAQDNSSSCLEETACPTPHKTTRSVCVLFLQIGSQTLHLPTWDYRHAPWC